MPSATLKPSAILNHLQELRKPSGKYLGQVLIQGRIQDHNLPRALVVEEVIRNSKIVMKPLNGAASLAHPQNRQSIRNR